MLKDNAESALIDCLDMVAEGKHYLSPDVSWILAKPTSTTQDPLQELTSSERRILHLVSEFKSNSQIAELLSISVRTVQNTERTSVKN